MNNRVEMLEATLDLIQEGVIILDEQSKVLFWNRTATALTGYAASEVIARSCPENLYQVNTEHLGRTCESPSLHNRFGRDDASFGFYDAHASYLHADDNPLLQPELNIGEEDNQFECPALVSMSHKLGYSVPAMLSKTMLQNSFGAAAGEALLFYPVEEINTLPHGKADDFGNVERSQANLEDRLEAVHHQWMIGRVPYGLLWIIVDQAQSLRTTHGRDACEAMLHTVEQTLLRQMKPAEIIGRWGNNEFLVLAHEPTAELLLEHARRLAGVARTADFRWWGDRVGLTVSIGASLAAEGHTLQSLLTRAQQAMRNAAYAGGNQVTEARGT